MGEEIWDKRHPVFGGEGFGEKSDNSLAPIRISTRESDIGFIPDIWRFGVRIFVDDVEHNNCITIDERKGYVITLEGRENEDGQRVKSEEILRGNVRIEGMNQSTREAHIEHMNHRVLVMGGEI